MSLALWTRESQELLYESVGYHKQIVKPDGSVWTRPAETDRFLYNWDKREHVVICPARASKSYSAAYKVLPLILGREPKADGSGPKPTRGWIVGPTYELAEKEFRYIWEALLVHGPKLGWPKPALARDSKKGGDLYILTAWGSEIVGKSADKPQSLLGEQLDWVLLSEAAQLPGDIWTRYLEPRLATTQGYAILPTTPDANAHWLYELYAKGLAGNELVDSYSWSVTGNPIYPIEEFESKKRFYGENHPVFREQYLGEWTFYSGAVYGHDYNIERNTVDMPTGGIPLEWRRIRSIDFGYRDPFVCLWGAITPDGELWIYREHYQPGRSMAEHANIIRQHSEGEHILYTVADSSEPQSIADLRRLGVPAMEANRDRRAGRMLVGDYLRSGKLKFVRSHVPELMRELAWYRWDKDKDKEGAKEATIGDDHAMDALRYMVMSRPRPSTTPYRIPPGSFAAEMQRKSLEKGKKILADSSITVKWTPRNIAKLAGLIEGEGWFYGRKGIYPEIGIGMTDRDVVEWVAWMFGSPVWVTPRGEGRKVAYRTQISGWRAVGIMLTIYTLMGGRRRAKIRELVVAWRNHPSRQPHRWARQERALADVRVGVTKVAV